MSQNPSDYRFTFFSDAGEFNITRVTLPEALASPPVAMDNHPDIDPDKTLCLTGAALNATAFVRGVM